MTTYGERASSVAVARRRRTTACGVVVVATLFVEPVQVLPVSWTLDATAQGTPSRISPPPSKASPATARVTQAAKQALTTGIAQRPWTGDFDGMVKRRLIRFLVPYSRTHYFIDKGLQRGLVYDAGVKLETDLNLKLKTSNATRIHVAFIPTSRDDLYDALVKGRGDIVAAGVTVTPERAALVDFTVPTLTGVKEIVVTGPGAPVIQTLDDLPGKTLYVRDRSIQFDSLSALNATFKRQGKPPVVIRTVPLSLEDEDILEMVNAGLLKATVVSGETAEFWKLILPNLELHPLVAVREQSDIAWAVRKGSPRLLEILNPFLIANGKGTVFGNVLLRKYLKDARLVRAATSPAELEKFNRLTEIFKKYGDKYGVDYLLMMAQGYQESRLEQAVKSRVGAVGVMQVMPATGKDLKVGDIAETDPNIHAGVKYIRFMIDEYFAGEPIDALNKGLFAFAAYNCGPGRFRQLRREAEQRGLNPNVWFNNVERIAAERIGRETVQYVSNIYKYYVAYSLTAQELAERNAARSKVR